MVVNSLTTWIVRVRRSAIGLFTAYFLASLLVGGTTLAEPLFYRLAVVLVIGMAVLPVRNLNRPLRIVELVMWNVTLGVVAAEVCLRAYGAISGTSLLLEDTLDAYRLQPGHDYGAGLRGNQLGYPGREFVQEKTAGTFRIAALGDSFAVGPAVPFEENYLTRLESLLPGVELYNFGVSGAGPREYLSILRRDVWRFQPDLILVSVFVGNDITETLATPRKLDPRRHAVYLCLHRAWRLARENSRAKIKDTTDRLRVPALSEEAFREVEARRLAVCIHPPPPSLEKKWGRALGYLNEIRDECRRRNVPVAFVLIPDEFQVNEDVLLTAIRDGNFDHDSLSMDEPQRRLLTWCEGAGVPCSDLLPALRSTHGVYARRDTHWNERGNQLAAEAVAGWLTPILPSRAR